jgi:PIN domain nuclease of toxin-antitoxin system
MRLLLDTHTLLWFLAGSAKLSTVARRLIEDPANRPLVSMASLWEIAVKASLGKLALHQPFTSLFPHQLQGNGIALLGITITHLAEVIRLPQHHRDPFDRMLVAQAISEQTPIVSADPVLDRYGITRLW